MSALAGSRVLVTGASGAFGQAVSTELRHRGALVAGLDIVGDPDSDVIACDLTSADDARDGVAEAVERLGGLDVLVNNAGVGGPIDSGLAPGPEARKIVEVNLFGAWNATAAALDALLESRGRVVFVGSRMAFLGLPLGAAYAVSKRGVTAYADCLRAEYGTHISVTCVHPAMVRTPIHDKTTAAGLSLEGVSKEEPLEQVVQTLVRACESPRPGPRRGGHGSRAAAAAGRSPRSEARGPGGGAPDPQARGLGRLRRRRDRRRAARASRPGRRLDSPRAPHQDRRHDRSGLRRPGDAAAHGRGRAWTWRA